MRGANRSGGLFRRSLVWGTGASRAPLRGAGWPVWARVSIDRALQLHHFHPEPLSRGLTPLNRAQGENLWQSEQYSQIVMLKERQCASGGGVKYLVEAEIVPGSQNAVEPTRPNTKEKSPDSRFASQAAAPEGPGLFKESINLCLRPLERIDNKDAVVMGKHLFAKTFQRRGNKTVLVTSISDFISEYHSLEQMVQLYPWFNEGLFVLLKNKLLKPSWSVVKAPLASLSTDDAVAIFESLAAFLFASSSVQAGVGEWRLQYLAVQELHAQHNWFTTFVEEVAQGLLAQVSWGTTLKLLTSAALTYIDVASDVIVAVEFYNSKQIGYAQTTMGFTFLALALQCLLTIGQNSRKPSMMTWELFLNIVFLKPALDVKKILAGEKRLPHQAMSIFLEQASSKIIEIVVESVPGLVLQSYIILSTPESPSAVQWLSVLSSA